MEMGAGLGGGLFSGAKMPIYSKKLEFPEFHRRFVEKIQSQPVSLRPRTIDLADVFLLHLVDGVFTATCFVYGVPVIMVQLMERGVKLW